MKNKKIKGWKVFNNDMTCKDFQYEVGKTYKQEGEILMCEKGFHFHENIKDLWNYYNFSETNKVCEVIAKDVVTGDDKSVCKIITIVRLMTWTEVLKKGNGDNNSNTGWNNTGDRNTGDSNTGYSNTGNRNTGDSNTGNRNTGYSNTGDSNTGNRNTGYSNTGYSNTGNRNTGDSNTGNRNTGDRNTGYSNTGNRNTGDRNTGDRNTGDSNTGNRNTGNRNTGDRNTGNFNSCDYSSGIFNSKEQKTSLFNGAAFVLMSEFIKTINYRALFSSSFNLTSWVSELDMTEREKLDNKYFYVQCGYLKSHTYEEACMNWWKNMTENNKQLIINIPGFDKDIFFDITGIKV